MFADRKKHLTILYVETSSEQKVLNISFSISYIINVFSSTCFFIVFETELSVERVKQFLHRVAEILSILAPGFLVAPNPRVDLLGPGMKSSSPGWTCWISLQVVFWPLCAVTSWSQLLESSWESQLRSSWSENVLRHADVRVYLVALVLAWMGETQGYCSLVP